MKLNSEIEDILVECFRSTKLFAKTFFPDRFYAPFSGLHDDIFDLIDSGEPRVAIAAPRGIGKTSIVGLALSAKKTLYQDARLIMHVSMTFDAACQQTENLKNELLSNRMIKKIFGSIKPRNSEGIDESFSKKSWVAQIGKNSGTGTLIYPRGSGQQVRGILYRNARPDQIVVDDLEDPETIMNDEIRRKRKEWFHADLLKCTSRIEKDWQIVYIDTLKHEDALLEELLESPEWESCRLELCNDELVSNAPEFVSNEEIKREHEYHRTHGVLDIFYREFRNIPIASEDAVFKSEYFKYYVEGGDKLSVYEKEKKEPEVIYKKNLVNVILCDPAKTVKLQSADSAIGAIGIDRTSRKIFVRDIIAGKMYPDELYNNMFKLVVDYQAMVLGVEVTSLHQFISQPIENEMRVRGVYPIYYEMNAVGKKAERVSMLAPLYKLGYMYHNKNCCQKLESQLVGFPRSKLWDVMDMLAYIIKVMDNFAYYFDPIDYEPEDSEMEFVELEKEDEEPFDDVAWI